MPSIRISIQVKVMALVTVMVIATAAVLGYAHVRQSTDTVDEQTEATKQQLLDSTVNMARMLEAALVSKEQLQSSQQMQELAGKLLRNMNGRVTGFSAYVLDESAEGGFRTIMSTIPPATTPEEAEADALAAQSLQSRKVGTLFGDPDVDPTAQVTVPIHLGSEMIGGVRLKVSLEKEYAQAEAAREQAINDSVRSTLIVSAIAVAIAAALAYILTSTIVKPVKQLTRAAEQISLGNVDVEVARASNDEIGDLAESFGRMVTAVKFLKMESESLGEVDAA